MTKHIIAAIFDLDDTLLDNRVEGGTIHELSRYQAIIDSAKQRNIKQLLTTTHQENIEAYATAKENSVVGAVWNLMYKKGLVGSEDIDYNNELLHAIATQKHTLHAAVLRKEGKPVEGAVKFIEYLSANGLTRLAIASSAIRRDIDIFLSEITHLKKYFPDKQIISIESITPGCAKPHPEVFLKAFASLGLDELQKPDVLVVEDDPRGIMAAKRAGLYAAGITTRINRAKLQDAGADIVVDTYSELRDRIAVL